MLPAAPDAAASRAGVRLLPALLADNEMLLRPLPELRVVNGTPLVVVRFRQCLGNTFDLIGFI